MGKRHATAGPHGEVADQDALGVCVGIGEHDDVLAGDGVLENLAATVHLSLLASP